MIDKIRPQKERIIRVTQSEILMLHALCSSRMDWWYRQPFGDLRSHEMERYTQLLRKLENSIR